MPNNDDFSINEEDLLYAEQPVQEEEPSTEDDESVPFEPDEFDLPEGESYKSPVYTDKLRVGDKPLPLPADDIDPSTFRLLLEKIEGDESLSRDRRMELIRDVVDYFSGTFKEAYKDIQGTKNLLQYLTHEGNLIHNSRLLPAKIKDGVSRLSNDNAVLRVKSKMGIGTDVVWNLWESGLRIRLGNFVPGDVFVFQSQLAHQHYEIGTSTRGHILSTEDAHIIIKIVDWILDTHVIACNMKGWTPEKIKRWLKVDDVYTLMCAALESIYPKGYPFIRNCSFNKEEIKKALDAERCDWSTINGINDVKHLVRLDFRKITHVDTDHFSPFQKKIISMPWDSITEEDLKRYHEEDGGRVVTSPILNEMGDAQYRVNIRSPFYASYKEESLTWLNYITRMVDTALEGAPDLSEAESHNRRIQTFTSYSRRASAMRHAAWVRDIIERAPDGDMVYGGDEEEDRVSISLLLEQLSCDEELADKLSEVVHKYKVDKSRTFVAIPNYKCPNCQRGQSDALEKRPGLIPISVPQYFFVIMVSAISL